MPTFVIGTGYTGRRLLDRLPADSVVGLSRSIPDTGQPVKIFDLDTDTGLPVELAADYAVIYTAPPKGEAPDQRLHALLSMLDPAPCRFVYISTTGVYGDCDGRKVSEESPPNPSTERSARRVAAEELLGHWAEQVDCTLIVLRVPGIYGPGRLGIERIQSRLPVIAEESANPGNRIHVDDLVRCCIAALSRDVPAGIYNVGDNDHRSSTWFTHEVARQSRLPAAPEISREAASKQFSPQRLSFMADSRRVDTMKMRSVLGVTPQYANPEDGIRASLQKDGC